jgi:hypothetical protein
MTGADKPLPEDVRQFVLSTVESVPFLEAMLLLRREPTVAWTGAVLADRLYIREAEAEALLSALSRAGLVAKDTAAPPNFRFAPQSEALEKVIGHVAETYAKRLVAVTSLIHQRSGWGAQQFADAFRIRND